MSLVSYWDKGVATWGVLDGSRVIPSAQLGQNFPPTLMALIADAEAFNRLSQAWRDRSSDMTGRLLTDLDMLPCIQRPGKVICLGVNYIDHAKEGGNQIGEIQAWNAELFGCLHHRCGADGQIRFPFVHGSQVLFQRCAVLNMHAARL